MGVGSEGPYVRLEGGWNHMNDLTAHGSDTSTSIQTTESEGYIVGGALGYGFGPFFLGGDFRAELNLDYRNNDINSVHVGGAAPGTGSGSVHSIAGMVNGIVDLPYNWMGFRPYVGAGAGLLSMNLDNLTFAGVQRVNDSDTVAAVQAMAGVRYNLTSNWDVGLEYRFLDGIHPSFHTVAATANRFTTDDYRNHSIMLNLTYSFGAPAAPPPPVQPAAAPAAAPPPPAPAPAATVPPGQFFIVFFDFDKSTITDAGRQVLDAAAAAFKQNRPVRIELTGYTDTVGTVQYNLGLSKRRADAVRDYLVKAGVPAKAQDVAWKGKTNLRVPTPDGVREPQNRRVEIVLPQ